ncbi:MAG TPA: hypothetical protein VKU00_15845, partial [Chthonomonadaceae bacterium]|nr:hypothetical protein [Chthonomonadaceae bacterium]
MRDANHRANRPLPRLVAILIALLSLCLVLIVTGARADDIDDVLHPFWMTHAIHRETLLFVKERGEATAKAHLTFPIQKLLSVRLAAWEEGRQRVYKPNRDFLYTIGSRTLTLTHRSAIPFRTRDSFYSPTEGMPYKTKINDPLNSYTPYGSSGKGPHVVTSDNSDPLQQVEVSYTYASPWTGYTPKFQATALRGALLKLTRRQMLHILVVGDSISYGFGSSALGGPDRQGYEPRRPGYVSLLVSALKR